MYRNRVDPLGELHAVPQRGAWFGNKGCLHDAHGQIRRAHAGKRWITCVTEFKGRRRHPLMRPGRYTELFFHDEATAYAAGHRPCAECRHADWKAFSALWLAVFAETGAQAIDARLHAARMDGRQRRLAAIHAEAVPQGAMIWHDGAAVLRAQDGWFRWSFSGYHRTRDPSGMVALLTPEPIARLFAEGLAPQIGGLHAGPPK